MGIFRKEVKFYFEPKSFEIIKCSSCGSDRLGEIGDVLICTDCGGAKALT